MCGIFGMMFIKSVAPRNLEQIRKFVTMLALSSADRGTDATGIAVLEGGETHAWHKDVVSSYSMVHTKKWLEVLKHISNDTSVILGHTRRATRGEKVAENSHPFFFSSDHGNLVGVHNGTVQNHEKFKTSSPYDVDSANVMYGLSQVGVKESVELLEAIQGSYALVWSRNDELYMARNKESPLCVAYLSSLNAMVFASTEHMIRMAASFAGIPIGYVSEVTAGEFRQYDRTSFIPRVANFKMHVPSYYHTWGDAYMDGTDLEEESLNRRFHSERPFARTEGTGSRMYDMLSPGSMKVEECATCHSRCMKVNMYAYGVDKAQCWKCRTNAQLYKDRDTALQAVSHSSDSYAD